MPRNLECIKQELEEAVARIPGTPASPLEEYFRFEETAASINDSLAYQEFVTPTEVEALLAYLKILCEEKAIALGVVLDFEG
ncbi:MAG: hypothetical protein V7742_14065 [Halioglobus sp.]